MQARARLVEGQIAGDSGSGRAVIFRAGVIRCGVGQGGTVIGGQFAVDLLDQIIPAEPQMAVAVLETSRLEIAGLDLGLPGAI